MRLLLIAYEFPPSPSPQSLRWTYLVRELSALGHEVHVLAPDLGGQTLGLPTLPDGVHVHRTFPGAVRGLLALARKLAQRKVAGSNGMLDTDGRAASSVHTPYPIRPPRNLRQRISEVVQNVAAHVYFPDIRGEWRFWARRRLQRLLATLAPDVVISSHEPATTLELGLLAKKRGFRWVADLGDPVLAGYTPDRWRARAHALERTVCARADLIMVTTAGAASQLSKRHGRDTRVAIVSQGFDDRDHARSPSSPPVFMTDRLELLYTGSFYRFRRADALVRAVARNPKVRLSIASITIPEEILAVARMAPENIRLLGFLPHTNILGLQRGAHMLVNIANEDMTQIPGKIYEYLGSQRPIVHLGAVHDPVADMVARLRCGWSCANSEEAISSLLADLVQRHAQGRLEHGLVLDSQEVATFAWRNIAERVDALLHVVASGARQP